MPICLSSEPNITLLPRYPKQRLKTVYRLELLPRRSTSQAWSAPMPLFPTKRFVSAVEEFLDRHIPAIKAIRPQASFIVWLDCTRLHLEHDALIDLFVDKARLALNDGEMFGPEGKGHMRLNVGTPRAVLQKALEQLRSAVDGLKR